VVVVVVLEQTLLEIQQTFLEMQEMESLQTYLEQPFSGLAAVAVERLIQQQVARQQEAETAARVEVEMVDVLIQEQLVLLELVALMQQLKQY
jgi:hypothetical protein